MIRTLAPRLVVSATLAGLLAACSSEAPVDAPAAAAEPAVIEERQDNFEAIGDAFKAVRGELEKDAPDFTLIAAKASDINTRAAKIEGHFPAGTSVDDGFDTEALAAIWQKPDDFKAAAQKLVGESAKLASLAGKGDKAAVGAQAMTMGGACKGCHDNFRLDDKK
ncbi:cytochrome c [Erythrobacter sp. T5W1-R]|uniref:c-type cytochrome n=1 Tax=Erythrobacter sp. T5W1-R TaxID=3101752 RepID=UPI002AFFE9A4|nr:cytochrome c [Erythrobacter sp. T5W1-R]MEA1619363.1 cytochrome c [Erythrobacter sp. T5W1-R]